MKYSCFKDKEFQEAWTDLDEIYRADFNTTGTGEAIQDDKFVGPLYHFYEDLADLLNSLKNKIIYSTKNDLAENPAQFDFSYADKEGDGSSYVCMTNTLAGKNYMVNKFRRPFGLSFKADSLNAMLKKHTIKTYSAFSTKGDYTSVSKTKNKDGSFKVKKHPTFGYILNGVLAGRGYNTTLGGSITATTTSAMLQFQAAQQIPQTGRLSAEFWFCLFN